jgi:hypothetical protein
MSEVKVYDTEFANIYENENSQTGEKFLSIKVFRDITLKKGDTVKLEKPSVKFERILNSPRSSDAFKAKTLEDQAKTPANVKMILSLKAPKN